MNKKLRMCQIWETGTQIPDYRTDDQKNADEVRKRCNRSETENRILQEADIYGTPVHYVVEEPYFNYATCGPEKIEYEGGMEEYEGYIEEFSEETVYYDD